jgi:nucleoid DNA-binding protein
LIHKAKTEEPKTVLQLCQTGLTGGFDRSDRCEMTQFGNFEAEDTRRDRKACVEAKQVAVARHPSDGENLKTSKTALERLVSLVVK